MIKTCDIVKMIMEFINRLPDYDQERSYQVCMFLLIDHIHDDYREKFLENFANALKIYQSEFFTHLEKQFDIVLEEGVKWYTS